MLFCSRSDAFADVLDSFRDGANPDDGHCDNDYRGNDSIVFQRSNPSIRRGFALLVRGLTGGSRLRCQRTASRMTFRR